MKIRLHRGRTTLTAIAAVMSLGLLAACGSSDDSGSSDGDKKVTTVRMGVPLPAMEIGFGIFAVGLQEGFWKEEGIDLQPQFLKDNTGTNQALAAGNIDIEAVTPTAVFTGIEAGQPLQYFYNSARRTNQQIAVLSDSKIKTVDDLVGKKIGVSSLTSGAKLNVDLALQWAGHKSSDVEYVVTGLGAPGLDAIQRGRVDALGMWAQAYSDMTAASNGSAKFRVISTPKNTSLFGTGLVAPPDWIKKNKDLAGRIGRAWTKSLVFMVSNKEKAVEDIWAAFPNTKTGTQTVAEAAKTLEAGEPFYFDKDGQNACTYTEFGSFGEDAVKNWVEAAGMLGLTKKTVDPSTVYTNELVKQFNDFKASDISPACK